MKILSKLQINSDRIMKNEELMILRGGYGDCGCICYYRTPPCGPYGYMAALNQDECTEYCGDLNLDGTWNCQN